MALVDGDLVVVWPDASSNGHDAIQPPSAATPIFKKNITINGQDAVLFDGIDDYMSIFPSSGFDSAAGYTFFMVVSVIGAPGTAGFLSSRPEDPPGTSPGFSYGTGPGGNIDDTSTLFEDVVGASGGTFEGTVLPGIGFLLITIRFDGFGFIEVRFNCEDKGAAPFIPISGSPPLTLIANPGSVFVGAIDDFSSQYLDGNIAEIILYKVHLPDEQVHSVETYLLSKFAPLLPLPGFELWLKGDDIEGSTGDAIPTWTSSSPTSGEVFSATGTPSLVVPGLNTKNTVEFIPAEFFESSVAFLATSMELTLFVVYKPDTISGTQTIISKYAEPGAFADIWFRLYQSGSTLNFHWVDGPASDVTVVASTPLIAGEWVLVSVRIGTGIGGGEIYQSGVLDGTSAGGPIDVSGKTATPVLIGARSVASSDPLDGKVAEVVVYDGSISDGQRKLVEQYLLRKWFVSNFLVNLVCYYQMEETSGTRFDSGPNGLDLTPTGTVTVEAGKIGIFSVGFDGSSGFLSLGDEDNTSLGNIDFCFCLWVYWDTLTGTQCLWSKGNTTFLATTEFQIISDGSDLSFSVGNGSTFGTVTLVAPGLTTGVWHFIVACHDRTNDLLTLTVKSADLAIDVTGSTSYSGGSYNSSIGMTFGKFANSSSGFFDGRIDNAAMWKNRLLSDNEILFKFNCGKGRVIEELPVC
jgi:hypothetical protein